MISMFCEYVRDVTGERILSLTRKNFSRGSQKEKYWTLFLNMRYSLNTMYPPRKKNPCGLIIAAKNYRGVDTVFFL